MTLARVSIGHGNIERETEKAIQVSFDDFPGVWLPKSQIELDLPEEKHLCGTLTMPVWLAKKAGLWGFNYYGDPICTLVED